MLRNTVFWTWQHHCTVNSKQLLLSAEDLRKIKPVNNFFIIGRRAYEDLFPSEELLAIDGCLRGGVIFPWDFSCWLIGHALVNGPLPCSYSLTLIRVTVYLKRQESGRGSTGDVCGGRKCYGGIRVVYGQDTLYACMELSKS